MRLKSQNKPIRRTAKTLEVPKSIIQYILQKNRCPGQLSNIKSPEKPQNSQLYRVILSAQFQPNIPIPIRGTSANSVSLSKN